jgi:hypothetical protein
MKMKDIRDLKKQDHDEKKEQKPLNYIEIEEDLI